MNKYFDLHCHPLAKNHLARYRENPSDDSGKKDLTQPVAMTKAFKDHTDEAVLRRLESQSCIDYLKQGKVHMAVASVSALEFGVASSMGYFADMLKNSLKKPFDERYFEVVQEGEVSYFNLLLREIRQYISVQDLKGRKPLKEGAINLLGRFKKDAREGVSDTLPNLVLAIEGGHNLCMKKIGNALEYDDFEGFKNDDFIDPNTRIPEDNKHPATVLKKLVEALWEKKMDVLYLTLTHLTHIPEQHLATHAFGSKSLRHPSFYPFGNGLTDLGKEVVDMAYSLKAPGNQKGKSEVLIDIAHMSMQSRLDLYEHRKPTAKNKEGYGHIPLVASHVGVTGYSINDWKDNLDFVKCVNHVDQGIKTVKIATRPKTAGYWGANSKSEFSFNPNTINLMDDDIIEVVRSGGIIGMGLDAEILGHELDGAADTDSFEFMTTAEFMTHFPYTGLNSLEYAGAEEIQSKEAWSPTTRNTVHPLSLCFNIVHIMAVVRLNMKNNHPEKHICIGSDFDGGIEPLKICSDSRYLKNLETNLLKWLPVAAKRYQKVNGGAEDLFQFTKKKKTLEAVVSAILYENGRDFLKSRGYLADIDKQDATSEEQGVTSRKKKIASN